MKKTGKYLALFLSFVMCVSLCSTTVRADGNYQFNETGYYGEEVISEEIQEEVSEEEIPEVESEVVSSEDSSNVTKEIAPETEKEIIDSSEKTEEVELDEVSEEENAENPDDYILVNEENFPDANFRQHLSKYWWYYVTNGRISKEDLPKVTQIRCDNENIADLTGIAFFPNLETLSCGNNQLTSIDVSKNENLKYLGCQNNPITSLDLSNNQSLEYLSCTQTQLTELDVSKNTSLYNISCGWGLMSSLDISKNTELKFLNIEKSQFKTIDVSHNTKLEILSCNDNQLTGLDVSNNPALRILSCDNNELSELKLKNNAALTQLTCMCNRIEELNLSDSPALEWCWCQVNSIKQLDLQSNVALTRLDCSSNQLTTLDVSKNVLLSNLTCCINQLQSLDVGSNEALTELDCSSNQITTLDVSNNTELIKLICSCNQMTNLSLNGCLNLEYLNCDHNNLTELDIQENPKIIDVYKNGEKSVYSDTTEYYQYTIGDPYVYGSQVFTVDSSVEVITSNVPSGIEINETTFPDNSFRNFVLHGGVLPPIDRNQNGYLSDNERFIATLDIRSNYIGGVLVPSTIYDLTGIEYFTEITDLQCSKHRLKTLNVSNNTKLTRICCDENQLESIDVSAATKLSWLDCHDNKLKTLDVSHNPELGILGCDNNDLESLDVSQNLKLGNLFCENNTIESLDISNNVNLGILDCSLNNIKELKISNNPKLLNIYQNGEKSVKEESGKKIVTYSLENTGSLTFDEGVSIITGDGPDKESVVEVFDDIPEKAWFVKAVQYVYDNNIMGGKGASFKPNDPITREEFVRVLYNHAGTPEVTIANPFADVKAGAWYEKSVLWAKEKNIANGKTKDGQYIFGVGQQIRREELARMIYMYAQLQGYDLTKEDTAIDGFSDASKVSTWAKDAMNWAVSQGVMGGKGGKLDPQGLATRAECASMIKNMIEKTAPK